MREARSEQLSYWSS